MKDLGFWILYAGHAQGLIGTQERPASAAPSDDLRAATILQLLGHDLSSRVRGELTDDIDVNRPVMPQMWERVIGRPRSPQAGSALGITRKQHGGGKNAPHKSDAQQETFAQKLEKVQQDLREAHRTQAPASVKRELERQIKHFRDKIQEKGESHSQRQKGPDNRGRGSR